MESAWRSQNTVDTSSGSFFRIFHSANYEVGRSRLRKMRLTFRSGQFLRWTQESLDRQTRVNATRGSRGLDSTDSRAYQSREPGAKISIRSNSVNFRRHVYFRVNFSARRRVSLAPDRSSGIISGLARRNPPIPTGNHSEPVRLKRRFFGESPLTSLASAESAASVEKSVIAPETSHTPLSFSSSIRRTFA